MSTCAACWQGLSHMRTCVYNQINICESNWNVLEKSRNHWKYVYINFDKTERIAIGLKLHYSNKLLLLCMGINLLNFHVWKSSWWIDLFMIIVSEWYIAFAATWRWCGDIQSKPSALVTWWHWKVRWSKVHHIALLHHPIFLLIPNETALIIRG